MADQNKTIKIAGLDLNPTDFGFKANEHFVAWMDHQGLKGQQRQDALNVYNDAVQGIVSGKYTLGENGAIEGMIEGSPRVYKSSNGKARNSGNIRNKDVTFSPEDCVRTYLYGLATHMKPKVAENKETVKKKAWSKTNGLSSVIGNDIFGEGVTPTADQINTWADNIEGVYSGSGKRSTEKRQAYINNKINAYITDLNNGVYDISDEDKAEELARMQELLNAETPEYRRNAIAPWLSNLLFTDDKYYASEEERQKAEEEAEKARQEADSANRIQQAQDYLKGTEGIVNPYEQGSDEYNMLEDAKIDSAFAAKKWDYTPNSKVYRSAVNEALPEDVFTGFNPKDLQTNLQTAFTLNTNEYGEDAAYKWFPITEQWLASEKHGRGKGDKDLSTTVYGNWLAANGGGDTTRGAFFHSGNNARTNAAWLGKAAMDWARYKVAQDYNKYDVGNGTYVLPQMVNWDTGRGYLFNFSTGSGTAQEINIGELISKLDKNSTLYKELLNSWRVNNGKLAYNYEGIPKGAKGMVITQKEQDFLNSLGKTEEASVNPKYLSDTEYSDDGSAALKAQKQQELDARYQHAQEIGTKALKREDESNRDLAKGLSTTDIMRIGAAAADVSAAIAAFVPGYGTATSAVLGLGSTGANLMADIYDPGVSTGQVLGGLAFNAGMDLLSLIPGLGLTGTAGKIAKNLGKTLPRLIAYGMAAGMAPGVISSLKKLGDPKQKFTAEDLRNISYGLSAVAGVSRIGNAAKNRRKFEGPKAEETNFGEISYRKGDGTEGKLKLSKQDVESIATSGKEGGQESALTTFRGILKNSGVPEADANAAKFLGNVSYKKQSIFTNPFNVRTKEVEFSPEFSDVTGERYAFLKQQARENAALRKKRDSKLLATDAEIFLGGAKPFRFGKADAGFEGRSSIRKQTKTLRDQLNLQADDILNTQGSIGNTHNGIVAKYKQELAKAKQDYDAAMKDPLATAKAVKEANVRVAEAQQKYNDAVQAIANKNAELAASGSTETVASNLAKARATVNAHDVNSYNQAKASNKTLYDKYKAAQDALAAKSDAVHQKEIADLQVKIDEIHNRLDAHNVLDKKTGKLTNKATAKNHDDFDTYLDLVKERDALINTRNEQLNIVNDATNKAAYNVYTNAETKLSQYNTDKANLDTWEAFANNRSAARRKLNAESQARKDAIARRNEAKDKIVDATTGKFTPEFKAKLDAYRNARRPLVNDITDTRFKIAAEKTVGKIKGPTTKITSAKTTQFSKFMNDLKTDLGEYASEDVIMELLANKEFMANMKASYKFKQGGILKAQSGVKTTSTADLIKPYTAIIRPAKKITGKAEPTKQDDPVVASNPVQQTEVVSASNVPILGDRANANNESKSAFLNLSNSDLALTGLEIGKFAGTLAANAAIANQAKNIKPAYKTPLRTEYKQYTSKPLLDQAQAARTTAINIGATAARNTTDQGAAFAYQLAALNSGENAAKPYILQADADTRASVDKAIANSNSNAANYHEVGDSNEAAKVAKENNDIMAKMQLIHDNATKAGQFINAIQHGVGTSASINYQTGLQAALNNDAQFNQAYQDYMKWDAIAKDTTKTTEERNEAALKVAQARNVAEARKREISAAYNRQAIRPVGVPFALPQYGYTTVSTPQSFNYDDDFWGSRSLKRGGVLEEYNKNLRHYSKLYFDTNKLLVTESNKKQKMMSNGYAYFHKLMMQGR